MCRSHIAVMGAATINYTISDCGTHYTVSPRCYFETKLKHGKEMVAIKLDPETGKLMIKPKKPPKKPKENERAGTSQMIYGGHLFLPKKCDFAAQPIIRHEGPVGQLLQIDVPKLPEFQTEAHPLPKP